MSLLKDLEKKVLIADGAMGTILYANGVGRCFEELNLTHPDQIQNVHVTYIASGDEVIQTNTYGANYIKLARYGMEEQVKKINEHTVQIAKRASNGRANITGNTSGIDGR